MLKVKELTTPLN